MLITQTILRLFILLLVAIIYSGKAILFHLKRGLDLQVAVN